MAQLASAPFRTQFAALRDPRQAAKVLYPLPELLLLLLCGTIAGADDFGELTLWARRTWRSFAVSCRSAVAFPATTCCAR